MTEHLLHLGGKLLPALFTGVALTLLYTVMPNARVRLRASLPAGIVAGFLWELSKFGYRWYMHRASHYGTLYGSLAAFPLFLLWIYVSWLVVLFGAQLAFARDAAHDLRLEEGASRASVWERLRVALHLALAAARNHRDGKGAPELVTLSHLGLPAAGADGGRACRRRHRHLVTLDGVRLVWSRRGPPNASPCTTSSPA
jgi:membrane protein